MKIEIDKSIAGKMIQLQGKTSFCKMILIDQNNEPWELEVMMPVGWNIKSLADNLAKGAVEAGIQPKSITITDIKEHLIN